MQCPKCGNPIEQDFGVFPCPSCNSVLFVDIEGQIQISEEAQGSGPVDSIAASDVLSLPKEEPVESQPISDLNQFLTQKPLVEQKSPQQLPPQKIDLAQEISEFANSELMSGNISYDLIIECIDTGELRDRLYDALADRRFRWDAKELIHSIAGGRLVLTKMNPVKASVLAHRLMELPLKISWIQKYLES